jgi:hypothetical protein
VTDDLIARAKAALKALDAQAYGGSAEQGALRRIGQESKFIRKARTLLPELLAEVERLRDDPCRCYHCPRCGDADDSLRAGYDNLKAEVERLRGALDRLKVEWLENYEYEGGDGGGPTGYVFKACADGLRAVLG